MMIVLYVVACVLLLASAWLLRELEKSKRRIENLLFACEAGKVSLRTAWLKIQDLEDERRLLWDTIDAQTTIIEMQNDALCERDGLDPEVWFDPPAAAAPPGDAWHADGLELADVRRRWQQPSWRWN